MTLRRNARNDIYNYSKKITKSLCPTCRSLRLQIASEEITMYSWSKIRAALLHPLTQEQVLEAFISASDSINVSASKSTCEGVCSKWPITLKLTCTSLGKQIAFKMSSVDSTFEKLVFATMVCCTPYIDLSVLANTPTCVSDRLCNAMTIWACVVRGLHLTFAPYISMESNTSTDVVNRTFAACVWKNVWNECVNRFGEYKQTTRWLNHFICLHLRAHHFQQLDA